MGARQLRRQENHGVRKILSVVDRPCRPWKYPERACARHKPIWWRRQLCHTSGRLLWDRRLLLQKRGLLSWERRTNRSRSTVGANSSSGQPHKPQTKLLLLPAPPSKLLLGAYCNKSSAISIWRAVNLTTDALSAFDLLRNLITPGPVAPGAIR